VSAEWIDYDYDDDGEDERELLSHYGRLHL
jgi:hypothetical protein